MAYFSESRAAFTLVELSIVLVILGLLVGGVLSGQSLIHAAELRAVTTELTNYKTALNSFRDKYFALPGDMNNAVKYWGAQTGGTADGRDSTCAGTTSPATGIATCNGDGDGVIGTLANTAAYEHFRAWQHLANAGLIQGTYTGISPTGANYLHVIGSNTPESKLRGTGYSFLQGDRAGLIGGGSDYLYNTSYGHILFYGKVNTTFGLTSNPVLKAEDIYNIDMKMDDGKPHQGIILSAKYNNPWTPNCVLSTNDAYNLASTDIVCAVIYKTGY